MKKYRKFISILAVILIAALITCSCSREEGNSSNSQTIIEPNGDAQTEAADNAASEAPAVPSDKKAPIEPHIPTITLVYEAEDGRFSGNVTSQSVKDGFSGSGYAVDFKTDGDQVIFDVNIDTEGFYDLTFTVASQGGYKSNDVFVDGMGAGSVTCEDSGFADYTVGRSYLSKGKHEISFSKSWGYVMVDKLTITDSAELPADFFDVPATLVNENATDNTKRLMSYLTDIYGKQILTGQYCDQGMYGTENGAIWSATGGEYPAVLGLDFMNYSSTNTNHGATQNAVDYAIEYWNAGGIVTFCWHWTTPDRYVTGNWYGSFYTDQTKIDIDKIMNGKDLDGYNDIMKDIRLIAEQFKKLQDAGVPVLFRPLHEASGNNGNGWFWWGAKGADAYKKLWVLLYEQLTDVYGCNNIIWVWNAQDPDWYPGDEYVDMLAVDIYAPGHDYSSQMAKFLELYNVTDSKKLIALSENGVIPDPELCKRDGAMWSFFATWSGEFVLKNAGLFKLSDVYTEPEQVKKVYASDITINRSELPDLKNYPIK